MLPAAGSAKRQKLTTWQVFMQDFGKTNGEQSMLVLIGGIPTFTVLRGEGTNEERDKRFLTSCEQLLQGHNIRSEGRPEEALLGKH